MLKLILLSILFVSFLVENTHSSECVNVPVYKKPIFLFNFKNCEEFVSNRAYCENEVTGSECGRFYCRYPHPEEENGYCRYGNLQMTTRCPIQHNLHYAGMHFTPTGNSGMDWSFVNYNIDVGGNDGTIYVNGTTHADVYEPTEYKTYIGIRLVYNNTALASITVFINGTQVLHVDDEYIDTHWFVIPRAMFDIEREGDNNEKIFHIHGYDFPLTNAQVMQLYEVGDNVTYSDIPELAWQSTEDCYNVASYTSVISSQKDWLITLIILAIVFCSLFVAVSIPVAIFIIRKIVIWYENESKKTGKLSHKELVETSDDEELGDVIPRAKKRRKYRY